jgi:hypothetical protein
MSEKKVQVFEYEGKRITFDFGDGEEMVNASEMAKVFGKRLQDFTRLKQTKDFIKILEKSMNTSKGADSHLSKKKAIRSVRGGLNLSLRGTWYEQRLALKLAAWLAPEFELWVYGKIRELLTTGQTQLSSNVSEDDINRLFSNARENEQILRRILTEFKKLPRV